MKIIYALVITFIVLMVAALAATFIYLEKGRHQTFAFVIRSGDKDIGDIKIDRYNTEEKIILTALERRWFRPGLTAFEKKLVLDKKSGTIERYTEENKGPGSSRKVFIEDKNSVLNFLTVTGSEFSVLSQIMPKRGLFIFSIDSLLSYIPMIDKYNFRKGRSQLFNTIYHGGIFLPPLENAVVLTSIRDEYIDVLGKKTKTECLVVRSKIFPVAYLWVAKNDRSIARFKIPKYNLEFTRVGSPGSFSVKEYGLTDPSYTSESISFKSGELDLSGTLTVPDVKKEAGEDPGYPAVLLISKRDFFNRDCGGIFCDISDYLSKNGFITLRFDKRGTGKSQGNEFGASLADDLEDAKQALNYLCSHDRVDKSRIAAVGHDQGGWLAALMALKDERITCLVLTAYNEPALPAEFKTEAVKERIKEFSDIYKEYGDSVSRSQGQTLRFIKEAKTDWISVFGNKVFVKRMREKSGAENADFLVKKDKPLLILQGKKDKHVSWQDIKAIPRKIIYFRNLGHFFGQSVTDFKTRTHYKIDKEVPETICVWLNNNIAKKREEKPPVQAPEAESPETHGPQAQSPQVQSAQ